MAECGDCGLDMRDVNAKSCTWTHARINGQIYKRNTTYFDVNTRCHDCGIENKEGNVHHSGCDMERCPRCKGQFFCCGCDVSELLKQK